VHPDNEGGCLLVEALVLAIGLEKAYEHDALNGVFRGPSVFIGNGSMITVS
jgi:hypothetical protein